MIVTDIDRLFVNEEATIADAALIVRQQPEKIAFVVDDDRRLTATVTDRLIRQALLSEHKISAPLRYCMHTAPDFGYIDQSEEEYRDAMVRYDIQQLPLLDAEQKLQGVAIRKPEWLDADNHPLAVIMAGGLGTRLAPLTDSIPKPMVDIHGKPLLEHIILRLKDSGFRDFALSVNYMGEIIENHFGDGSAFGISIRYIREKKRMGTAGSLGLLSARDDQPIFVTNGDILTGLDFESMMTFHTKRGGDATISVNTYSQQIPYGVVTMDHHKVSKIEEKPVIQFLANSANYIVNGACLKELPADEFFDMPEFLNMLASKNRRVLAYPLYEYWQDVGNMRDLERTRASFAKGETNR